MLANLNMKAPGSISGLYVEVHLPHRRWFFLFFLCCYFLLVSALDINIVKKVVLMFDAIHWNMTPVSLDFILPLKNKFWRKGKKWTYSTDKRIISFLHQVCQSCSRINNGSSVALCWKCCWINRQQLPIDSNAPQIQSVMRPERQEKENNQTLQNKYSNTPNFHS